MARRPLVLIHGYSDSGDSFKSWAGHLEKLGYETHELRIGSYQSLTNEITIKDIAEGLDRALRDQTGLKPDADFDAIVHSTGGLVIRSWLTAYEGRRGRVRNIIMLAPANFGSPMAHKGRSWLGSLFKGNKSLGPDFLEAGDQILSGLELGSRFTWELALTDLLGEERYYGPTSRTPYVFVFVGTDDYGWLKRAVTEPGTDGTVRWSGCALNCRKIEIDLTVDPQRPGSKPRIQIPDWPNVDMPLVLVDGVNHGTIMSDPTKELVEKVAAALEVSSRETFESWFRDNDNTAEQAGKRGWQQFVTRVVDERGDPVTDYNLFFYSVDSKGREREVERFADDVHAFTDDKGLRCFHVDLSSLRPDRLENLFVRILASSGTRLVGYHGYGSHNVSPDMSALAPGGKWDADIELTEVLRDGRIKFFYPFTTTFVEIRLDREPHPLVGISELVKWVSI